MTRERDLLDEYFGERQDEALQDEFLVLPLFRENELVDGDIRPEVRESQRREKKEKKKGGTKTNITEIEIIYPFLLKQEGVIDIDERRASSRADINKAAITGTQLHFADSIFSIALHGIKGNLVDSFLPSYEEDDRNKIKRAVSEIDIPINAAQEEIEESLMLAWGRFRNLYSPKELEGEYEDAPLPGFGIPNPKEEREFARSREVDEAVSILAAAWAREAVKDKPMSWEFIRNPQEIINQREITTAIKFVDPHLQVVTRFDSISRRVEGKVTSQLIDFKTGRVEPTSSLDREIRKRQDQLMYVMAERFTAQFLREFRSLDPDEFPSMRAYHETKVFEGRVQLAGKRYLDLETGKMFLERIELPPTLKKKKKDSEEVEVVNDERVDFNRWFTWYGKRINELKSEVKDVLSRRIWYDLRGVELDKEALERVY